MENTVVSDGHRSRSSTNYSHSDEYIDGIVSSVLDCINNTQQEPKNSQEVDDSVGSIIQPKLPSETSYISSPEQKSNSINNDVKIPEALAQSMPLPDNKKESDVQSLNNLFADIFGSVMPKENTVNQSPIHSSTTNMSHALLSGSNYANPSSDLSANSFNSSGISNYSSLIHHGASSSFSPSHSSTLSGNTYIQTGGVMYATGSPQRPPLNPNGLPTTVYGSNASPFSGLGVPGAVSPIAHGSPGSPSSPGVSLVPAVVFRGLPYSCTEKEVLFWIKTNIPETVNLHIRDILVKKDPVSGKNTGFARILLDRNEDCDYLVSELHHKKFGHRYIEVFPKYKGVQIPGNYPMDLRPQNLFGSPPLGPQHNSEIFYPIDHNPYGYQQHFQPNPLFKDILNYDAIVPPKYVDQNTTSASVGETETEKIEGTIPTEEAVYE